MGQSRDRDECVWEVCLSDLHPTRSWHERVHLTTTFFMTIRLEISLTVEAMRRFFLSLVDRWSNDSWVFRQGFRFLLTWNPKIIIIMWYREQETTVHTARLLMCTVCTLSYMMNFKHKSVGFYSPWMFAQTRNLLWQEGAYIKHIGILKLKYVV